MAMTKDGNPTENQSKQADAKEGFDKMASDLVEEKLKKKQNKDTKSDSSSNN